MYKIKILSPLLLLFVAQTAQVNAQDLQVFASGGQAAGDNAFTIGETFVAYQAQPTAIVTEGFHQPALGPSTGSDPAIPEIAFGLSPNPASEVTFLHALLPLNSDYKVTLIDLHGHLLWTETIRRGEAKMEIPLHAVSQSMYFLRVEGETQHIFKLEKIAH